MEIEGHQQRKCNIGEEKIHLRMPYAPERRFRETEDDEGQLNISVDLRTRPANIDIEVVPNNYFKVFLTT